MLYYLFRALEQFGVPGSGMWSYISFRSLLALMLALVISAWFGEKFIKFMKRRNISETQRDASIDPFGVNKIGVPSMGGVIIIVAILVPCLLLGRLRNIYMILMIVTTVWLGALGFLDDYIKIFRKNKDGLAGRYKILGQVGLGLIVGLTLYLSPDAVVRENVEIARNSQPNIEVVHKSEAVKSTKTTIPFVKNNNLDYTEIMSFMGDYKSIGGVLLMILVTVLVIAAVSNGANLNDGMDGMAAGNSAIICIALGILAYVSSHIEYASYLNIMYIPGSQELVIFICADGRQAGSLGATSQGIAVAHPLRHLPAGESQCYPSGGVLQVLEAPRQAAPHLQAHAHPRCLPHPSFATRARVRLSPRQVARRRLARKQDYRALLDFHHPVGRRSDYYAQNKVGFVLKILPTPVALLSR